MAVSTKSPQPPKLSSLDALAEAAECLKTLAHPHRLRMLQLLLQGRYAVGELAERIELLRAEIERLEAAKSAKSASAAAAAAFFKT